MNSESDLIINWYQKIKREREQEANTITPEQFFAGDKPKFIQVEKPSLPDCSECEYELYFIYEEDGKVYFFRDCINMKVEVQEYFSRKVHIKMGCEPILPIQCKYCKIKT